MGSAATVTLASLNMYHLVGGELTLLALFLLEEGKEEDVEEMEDDVVDDDDDNGTAGLRPSGWGPRQKAK